MKGSKILGLCLFLVLMPAVALSATFEVTIDESGFNPSTLTINKGDTVRWVNRGTLPHSVTSGIHSVSAGGGLLPDGIYDSGILNPADTFEHTFTVPGAFSCDDKTSPPFATGSIVAEGVAISPGNSILLIRQDFDLIVFVTANYPDLTIAVVLDGTLVFDGSYSSFISLASGLGIPTHNSHTGKATIIPIRLTFRPFSFGTHMLNVTVTAPSGFLATDEVTYTVIDISDFSS